MKNKWASTIFGTCQRERSIKRAILELAGVFKSYGIEKLQELTMPLIKIWNVTLCPYEYVD